VPLPGIVIAHYTLYVHYHFIVQHTYV
jgi:hypothetical protein